MGRCIQLVMGPAGSGKSTYCSALQEHCKMLGRTVHVANLDPAAEHFSYDVAFDVKELITVDDVMQELELGPNGALIYCMEFLLEQMDWLKDKLEEFCDDDYLVFDCPGQIELYTHVPIMRRVVDLLKQWGYNLVSVFVVDATFVTDVPKFISGSLLSLSAMIQLELPHVNVLSKCDLVDKAKIDEMLDMSTASSIGVEGSSNAKLNRLTKSISSLIDDYSQVSFLPLDITDEDSIAFVLAHADHCIQFGEDAEVKMANENEDAPDFEDGGGGD
jgi:GTPase SAR1 family protein